MASGVPLFRVHVPIINMTSVYGAGIFCHQASTLPLTSTLSDVDIATLFSDSMSGLLVDENGIASVDTSTDDAFAANFCFSSELMDFSELNLPTSTTPAVCDQKPTLPTFSFKSETISPLLSPTRAAADLPKVTFASFTPTSGPTPVMTPVNSVPSSPCGSYKSGGYSSGWGPPSPPHRDPQKKRGGGRGRARKTTGAPGAYTPVSYPASATTPTNLYTIAIVNDVCGGAEAVAATTTAADAQHESTLPRHKRPSHIRATHKRRNKIQVCQRPLLCARYTVYVFCEGENAFSIVFN